MRIINCRECGTLCVEISAKLCARCHQEYLEAEIKVAEYLRLHENSTIDEVNQATKVEKHIILKMLRDGRIIEGNLAYACESCGAAISSGRMCKNCEAGTLESLEMPGDEKSEQPGSCYRGMYSSKIYHAQRP